MDPCPLGEIGFACAVFLKQNREDSMKNSEARLEAGGFIHERDTDILFVGMRHVDLAFGRNEAENNKAPEY
jgi:hypothetical protein